MATKYSDIVTAILAANPTIAEPETYMGNLKVIPFFIDADVALVDSGDVIIISQPLPPKTRALAIGLCHDGSNGLASSTTVAVKAGTTVLTTSATYATSTDTNGACNILSLKNTDVSGSVLSLTVGGADWSDSTDLYGFVILATA